MSANLTPLGNRERLSLLGLMNPREQTRLAIAMVLLGVIGGAVAMRLADLPLWGATALVLALLLIPGALKCRADARRFGWAAALLAALLAAQGFHTVEHIAQWVQYHLLNWTARASSGLLSPANTEWVHFVWNWLVLATVIALVWGGMRGLWMWALLAWSAAHTFEHSYMFIRHLIVLAELQQLGVSGITAQGLPGILGRDGWLARSELTRNTFLCTLPGLTTANRLDVHFWWNVGETVLLLVAGQQFLQARPGRRAGEPAHQR